MRILLTGATGVVGAETAEQFAAAAHDRPHTLVRVARRPPDDTTLAWTLGTSDGGPPPEALRGHWDVIVHTAASTRWTQTRAEATAANVEPLRAVLRLADRDTHLVHVSTAYVAGERDPEEARTAGFDGYRNGYEWSKAVCERVAAEEHPGPLTLVRPPLVLGRRGTGRIARFSGPYTLFHALTTGLAAAVIGDPDSRTEISPVDEVAALLVRAALGPPPERPRVWTSAAGPASLTLAALVETVCATLDEFRAGHGAPPVPRPPLIPTATWNRFLLPLADEYLTPMQNHAVALLAMFQSYTSMTRPFEPTHPVDDPAAVLAASVRYWAAHKPRQALADPHPWTLPT